MLKIYLTLIIFLIELNLSFTKDNKDKILIIIRHAEKISDDYTDLSPIGKSRAECLPYFFFNPSINYIPSKLYANKRNMNTTRSYDTIFPLSKILNLEIEEFEKERDEQIENFVNNKLLKDEHDIILICSSHGVIPKITKLLGHEIIVNEEDFDKYFIWKNGVYESEGNQSDYIEKCIEEHN